MCITNCNVGILRCYNIYLFTFYWLFVLRDACFVVFCQYFMFFSPYKSNWYLPIFHRKNVTIIFYTKRTVLIVSLQAEEFLFIYSFIIIKLFMSLDQFYHLLPILHLFYPVRLCFLINLTSISWPYRVPISSCCIEDSQIVNLVSTRPTVIPRVSLLSWYCW